MGSEVMTPTAQKQQPSSPMQEEVVVGKAAALSL